MIRPKKRLCISHGNGRKQQRQIGTAFHSYVLRKDYTDIKYLFERRAAVITVFVNKLIFTHNFKIKF